MIIDPHRSAEAIPAGAAWHYDASDPASVLNTSGQPAADGERVLTLMDLSGNGNDCDCNSSVLYRPNLVVPSLTSGGLNPFLAHLAGQPSTSLAVFTRGADDVFIHIAREVGTSFVGVHQNSTASRDQHLGNPITTRINGVEVVGSSRNDLRLATPTTRSQSCFLGVNGAGERISHFTYYHSVWHYTGYVHEILFYPRLLSEDEYLKVEAYFAEKWGL